MAILNETPVPVPADQNRNTRNQLDYLSRIRFSDSRQISTLGGSRTSELKRLAKEHLRSSATMCSRPCQKVTAVWLCLSGHLSQRLLATLAIMHQPVAENSRHYQNYGYMNWGYHASHGGTMHVYNQQATPTVFDLLAPHVVQDALYDSAQRQEEHAVACQPETRTKILHDIRFWADSRSSAHVCWLSGPAGTGKTTVTHTIAAEYDQRGQLAATFFFWRKTGDRDDIKRLVPTLAYQIAQKIPSAKEAMEKLLNLNDASRAPLRDPFSKLSLEDQLSTFLIASVNPSVPNLIVIDGLDECASQDGIRRLIEWIRKKSPFRFLLASRCERVIEASFSPDPYRGHADALILSLTESKDDIRRYFVEQLGNLWRKERRLKDREPLLWPSQSDLEKLVKQSEGLFVYAATAVRHISGKGSPENRLEGVLKLHQGLDNLYIQAIEEASEWDYFSIVMGSILYLRYPLIIDDLSSILHALDKHLTMSGIRYALGGCHSILTITNDYTAIEPYHASLRDFLTDQSRSQILFHPPATSHGRLMFACLSAITRAFNDGQHAPKYAVVSWYYHSRFFLSSSEGSKELEELRDDARELVKKIDLNWVREWMIQALCWAGVPYLRKAKFPTKDLVDTYWTRLLEPTLRNIDGILEAFETYTRETQEAAHLDHFLSIRPLHVVCPSSEFWF